jgi:hypothetical protein
MAGGRYANVFMLAIFGYLATLIKSGFSNPSFLSDVVNTEGVEK